MWLQEAVEVLHKHIREKLADEEHLVLVDDVWKADSELLKELFSVRQQRGSSLVATSRFHFAVDEHWQDIKPIRNDQATEEASRDMMVSYAFDTPSKTFESVRPDVKVCRRPVLSVHVEYLRTPLQNPLPLACSSL